MQNLSRKKVNEMLKLAQFLKENEYSTLESAFTDYALYTNRAKGSVRNLYYDLVKFRSENLEFFTHAVGDLELKTHAIDNFSIEDERILLEKILTEKAKGRSVRSIVMGLANGDGKLMLRYQNKYRNMLKNRRELVDEINVRLNVGNKEQFTKAEIEKIVGNKHMLMLQNAINKMIDSILSKVNREKQVLMEKNARLEEERLKLYKIVFGSNPLAKSRVKFFKNT